MAEGDTSSTAAAENGQSRTPVPTGDNTNRRSDNRNVAFANKIVNSANEIVDSDNRTKVDLVKETMEIDSWARENVPEYMKLSDPNRRAVRATVRQARAAGISETSARTMARVAARSGLNVVFDFEGLNVKGDDGLYDGSNTIFLNPNADGQRLARSLLLHEAGHALIQGNAGTKAGDKAIERLFLDAKKIDSKMAEKIRNKYEKYYKEKGLKASEYMPIVEEEVLMRHLEDVLGSESAWEYILSEDASIGQRFLSFLKRSAQVYSDSDALSSESRRLLRDYKKLFDSFAERNYQNNATVYEKNTDESGVRYALIGRTADGRGIYRSNYPENTPKTEKQKDIIDLVQNVWSKKAIKLNIISDGKFIEIEANFNPELTERSDLSKIAFGNRKGTASEKRITMNLSSDLYQIAEEARYVRSKTETGKDNAAHTGVKTWHYFLTDLVYVEADGTEIDCYMNIDVKQNDNGNWFYSFAIEKGSRPADVLSVVTDKSATTSTIIISDNEEKSNSFSEKNSENVTKERRALPEDDTEAFFGEDGKTGTEEDGLSRRQPLPEKDGEGKAAKRVPSRGEVAKRHANENSDRVYNRSEIFEALKRIVPGDIVMDVTDQLWEGLNSQRNAAERTAYIESMIPRVNKMLIVESNRFENADPTEIRAAETRIAAALKDLLSAGTESKRVRLDAEAQIRLANEKMKETRKNAADKIAKERGKRSKREEHWKTMAKDLQSETKLRGLLSDVAYKMKDLKLGHYHNATEVETHVFKGSIEKLSKIQFRGNLVPGTIRKTIKELRDGWYKTDNKVLEYVDKDHAGLYNEAIAEMMDSLSSGEGTLSVSEMKTLHDVMSYFVHFVENFGKVYRKGKWVDANAEAERYIGIFHENSTLNVGLFNRLAGSSYTELFGDPMTVARRMDMYAEGGFYTEFMQEFRDAAVDAQVAEMDLREAYDAFMDKNKRYVEKALVDEVEYRGAKLSRMHLIGLYMTMKRQHAVAGFVYSGFCFDAVDGKRIRVPGLVSYDTKVTAAELEDYAARQRAEIESKLTDADKEYIKILEKVYNEDARQLKVDRDMQRFGFTNASYDYYYPIRRGNIGKSVDTDIKGEIDRVSSASFNKDTVKGAKQELFIESADAVFNRHLRAVCQYAFLSPVIDSYDVLYNRDISGNKNRPISVATESHNLWQKGDKYFKKLIADVQGISPTSGEGQAFLGKIRGGYAKYQLGANPKVWVTQLSSIFASSSILDGDCIVRGMSISADGMDEYCSLAKLRNYDNTAAMSQAVLDTRAKRAASGISRFSDLLMAPIGKTDRFVVGRVFGACQAQVEKNGGPKVGTKENKVEAGKLLRRVILETQQNSIATERSAAMRSGNEIFKAVTMFSADGMKVIGRVIDSVGELSMLRARLKAETDASKRAALEASIKKAGKKVSKSVGALTTSAVFMVAIAQLFRHIYDKEKKEDENLAASLTVDFVGNLMGGLPVIRDVYSKIFDGFDVSNYTYDMFNDLIDSATGLFDVAGNIMSGEGSPEERNLALRNLAYSVGQFTGLPFRNVYNVFYGLTKRFSPETAYRIDSAFYTKNVQNDLYKAIEAGDDRKVAFTMEILLGERIVGDVDEAVYSELLALSKAGQKVLPKTMPTAVTVDGGEYELSSDEREVMKSIYSGSEDALKKLFSTSSYKALTDEQKSIAIGYVNEVYYDKARAGALSSELSKKSTFADAVGVDKMAILYVKTRGIESDKDATGKTVSGSKKKKVLSIIRSLGGSNGEKLLMLYASGYTVSDGDIPGLGADAAKRILLSYIMKLPGKKSAEKAAIAEACGFTVANGRVKIS